MKVAIYCQKNTGRTKHIALAMQDCFKRHNIQCYIHRRFTSVVADLAVAYGWIHAGIFKEYRKQGKNFLYFDLGYWNRRPDGKPREGCYRYAVNSWDTYDCMPNNSQSDRFDSLNIPVKPWGANGKNVLVTGMSNKAAMTHGFKPGEWETSALSIARKITDGPVTLRVKPVSKNQKMESIETALSKSRFLITHHSNTAIDALVAGVPYHCRKGVGKRLSEPDLTKEALESPRCVNDRDRMQLLYDVAYCQLSPDEMRSGEAWEILKCISVFR